MTIIFDIEASCEDRKINPNYKMETIEIGAVKIENGEITEKFQTFIEPEYIDSLTDFCTNLTGIKYEDLEDEPKFSKAILDFYEFFYGSKIYSCGQFDRKFLTREIKEKCEGPSYSIVKNAINHSHVNLKDFFTNVTGIKAGGMLKMANDLGIEMTGTHHRALDDSLNLAKIYLELERIREEKLEEVFSEDRLKALKNSLSTRHGYVDKGESIKEIADYWGTLIVIDYDERHDMYIYRKEKEAIQNLREI